MEKETGVYCISKIRKEKPVPIFVARKLSIVQWLIPFWVAQTCGSREYKYSEGWWRKMPSVRSPSKSRGAHHAAVPSSSSLPSGCSVAAGDEWIISDTAAKKLAYWPVSKEGGKLGLRTQGQLFASSNVTNGPRLRGEEGGGGEGEQVCCLLMEIAE